MRPASQLIEQGIKSYTRGQLTEAERFWREALALEPLNDRARAYLDLLRGAPHQPLAAVEAMSGKGPAAAAVRLPVPLGQPGSPVPLGQPGQPGQAAPPAGHPDGSSGRSTLSDFAPSPWDQGPAEQSAIVLEGEGGLDLTTIDEKSDLRPLVPDQGQPTPPPQVPRKPISDVEVWMQGARELHALGDFSGSLEMIEKILKLDPAHAEARAYLAQNEATLIAMYESKLGSMGSIPRLAIKPEEVLWLNLDHRAGFLLAQIDGLVNYEDLFALSGLPRLDTARILATLLQEGVIVS